MFRLTMNLRLLPFVVIGFAVVSCDSNTSVRFGLYSKLNLTNLVAECRQLAESGVKQNGQRWKMSDSLPPEINSLSPQFVHLHNQGEATVIDIQISGGFEHRGLLVVCQSDDPNLIPHKGRHWRITKIGPGVFEYRE